MTFPLYGCAAACILSVVLTGQTRRQAGEHTIDLVSAPPLRTGDTVPPERRLTFNLPVAVVSDAPVKPNPIRIDAPRLDRGDYTAGDSFVFEITFENVSDVPVRFPTWTAEHLVDRNMPGASMASVAITFEDEHLGRNGVGRQTLAGADTLPGSLIVVRPKERVRIRAQGKWVLMNAGKGPMPERWTRPLRVQALVMLVGNGVTHFIEESNASAAVLLRR